MTSIYEKNAGKIETDIQTVIEAYEAAKQIYILIIMSGGFKIFAALFFNIFNNGHTGNVFVRFIVYNNITVRKEKQSCKNI